MLLSQEGQQSSPLQLKLRQVYEIINSWPRHDSTVEVFIDLDVFDHVYEYFFYLWMTYSTLR